MAMAAQTTTVTAPQPEGARSWITRVKDYVDELKAEMRRVTWPTSKQVRATTAVVIVTIFLFAAYFAAVDLLLGRAINQIFQTLARR
jgi:preprotein translocase subunit SecE